MDYVIQQLTLIHQSIHSSVDYKAGGTQEQLVILNVLNSEHLTSKGGLPSLMVPDVLQDATGLMWFATGNGGCRCNSYSHKTFHNDPGGLHSSIQLLSGCADQRGSTGWYGTGRDYPRRNAMKRKLQLAFVILLVISGLLLTGCGGAPKTKTYTIGVLNPSLNQEDTVKGFKEGMTELGYSEGENVTYIYDGPVSADQLDVVAQGLVKAKVNLILAITTSATRAAQKATAGTDIAVVFIPVTDPVGAGVVASLTKPGGNTTGVTTITQEGKRLEWLLQVAPRIKHIYIVYNPRDPSPVLALKTVSDTATKLGVELITREVGTTEEADAAFKNIPTEADAIFFLPDSVVNFHGTDSIKLAIKLGLPTSGANMMVVNDGALTAYGIDLAVAARQQAARLASQILQGTKPADLPVETTQLFSAINLKTAQAIGLDIPDDILRQANIIIR